MAAKGVGYKEHPLKQEEVRQLFAQAVDAAALRGKKVLCIIPDSTRTCPLPFLFRTMCETAGAAASKLDFLIALGTHPPMSDEAINALLGLTPQERRGKYVFISLIPKAVGRKLRLAARKYQLC